MRNNITYNMDALEAAKLLPDQCVDCIVTSPPYYGLRDYGTTTWVGGDPACDHKGAPMRTRANINQNSGTGKDKKNANLYEPQKNICNKCGAIRIDHQIGLEESPEKYIEKLVLLFRELRRILKNEGTVWLNIGDSYNGYKGSATRTTWGNKFAGYRSQPTRPHGYGLDDKKLKFKDLIGIPWMLAFALRADGWYLRSDIIWHKPNPMPESVTDRPTKSHEYIFLLSKSLNYYFDHKIIMEKAAYDGRKDTIMKGSKKYSANCCPDSKPQTLAMRGHQRWTMNEGEYYRNKRSVWTVCTKPLKEAHFAAFPEELIIPCILAGCPDGGTVLDPFNGSGTTRIVANKFNRNAIGFELNPEYIKIEEQRRRKELGIFNI